MANRSPPMPHDIGSISPIAALVAMAASAAFPPRLRTSSPTWAASGWLVATIPFAATVTDRPALYGAGVGRSAADASAVRASMTADPIARRTAVMADLGDYGLGSGTCCGERR